MSGYVYSLERHFECLRAGWRFRRNSDIDNCTAVLVDWEGGQLPAEARINKRPQVHFSRKWTTSETS
jgi:hypothetical protein